MARRDVVIALPRCVGLAMDDQSHRFCAGLVADDGDRCFLRPAGEVLAELECHTREASAWHRDSTWVLAWDGVAAARWVLLTVPCAIDVGAKAAIMKTKRRGGIFGVMSSKSKSSKSLRSLITAEQFKMVSLNTPISVNIDALPSLLPPKKYCDITGFPCAYTDPVTKLRFVSKDAFRMARKLPDHRVEEFPSLRKT